MDTHSHDLTYKIEAIPSGYLGQCVEIPQIIVQAKSKNVLGTKIGVAIEGYLKACPQAHKSLNKTVGYAHYALKA